MNRQDLRKAIVDALKVNFDNVEEVFVFPEETAEAQSRFPYVTVIFGVSRFQDGTRRYIQNMDIIGIDRGENRDLAFKQDQLVEKIFTSLYKNSGIEIVIEEADAQNLFKPFGLDMGISSPFTGVRFRVLVPGAITI